jgi:mono/diheme cytochrome c family protein
MKRALKWLGSIVGVLIVLLAAGFGTVYAITMTRMAKDYPTSVESVRIPSDSASVSRGKHLVEAVGKCQGCHGDNYAGTAFFHDPVFAQLTAPNLTSGKGGIGATFTDADYIRAIRHGVGKDGKSLLMMPAEAFYHFNDADLGAVIAYIKSLPPADQTVPSQRSIGPIARAVYLLSDMPLLSAPLVPVGEPRPADVTPGPTREYGEYLTKAGGCTSCHGPSLSGGTKIDGVMAANLTPGGEVGKWSEADFTNAIRTGVRPNKTILSAAMPWPYARNMNDDEMHATWLYIHSLPAKETGQK